MSRTEDEERELLQECEDALRERAESPTEEAYEGWEDDPVPLPQIADDEPSLRTVVLEEERHVAHFHGPPLNEIWVYQIDAKAPLKLPYFDPTGRTDKDLVERLKTLLPFS